MSKTNVTDYRFSIFINNDQAKKSLVEMEKVMQGYETELKRLVAENKKDSDEYRQKKKIYDDHIASMAEMRKEAGLNALSLKELKNLKQQLNNEFARAIPGTEHHKRLEKELGAVNARLGQVSMGAQTAGLSIGKMAEGFNKYFAIVTAAVASVTGLIFSFRQVIDTFNQYEKKVSNLSALTGLAGEELAWLSDEAKTMSTSMVEGSVRITQSADAIVDAFTKVGSARPELLKNKEDLKMVSQEAIILSQAANSELQPAVAALTMVLNQFNAPASESRRIINILGAGAKEGAGEIPYLTEAIEKSGTVAADAGMSIEELVGVIETLAPRITQPEIAGRSLRAVILKLQETSDDTNPAIVGFATAIENLGKQNLTTTELTKLFGMENITTAKILLNNTAETEKYTAAVTGTNIAIEQATINTDNNSSRLDQAKNRVQLLSIELGQKLAPALTFSTNAFSYLMKAILGTIGFFNEHRTIVLSTLAAVAAYTVVVYGAMAVTKAFGFITEIASKAVQLLNLATKSNPWGLIVAVVAAAVTALAVFSKKTEEAIDSQKRLNDLKDNYNKKVVEEKAALDLLIAQLKATNNGTRERGELIDKINEKYGTTLKNMKDEKQFLQDINDVYQNIVLSIQRKALAEARQDELTKIYKEMGILEQKRREATKPITEQVNQQLNSTMKTASDLAVQVLNAGLADLQKQAQELMTFTPDELKLLGGGSGGGTEETPPGGGDKDKKKELKTRLEQLNAEITKYMDLLKLEAQQNPELAAATAKKIAFLEAEKAKIEELISDYLFLARARQGDIQEAPLLEYPMGAPKSLPGGGAVKNPEPKDNYQPDLTLDQQVDVWANKASGFLGYADTVLNGLSGIDAAMSNYENAQLAKDAATNEQKKANLKRQLDGKLISQKTYDQQMALLNDQFEEKRRKLQVKQAKRQRELSLIQAIIGVAQAVIAGLNTQPFMPLGIIMGALAAVLGGIQIGYIASTPIPEAAGGRYNVIGQDDGKTYKNVPYDPAFTGIPSGPLLTNETGREIVIDPYTTRNIMMNYPEIIDGINYARVPQRAMGSYFETPYGPGGGATPGGVMVSIDPRWIAAMEKFVDQSEKGFSANLVYDDLREKNQRVAEIEARATR